MSSHEQAQDARLASQLLGARALLRECSAAACPALISRDCVSWLAEVEQQLPSVIFRATKDGSDVVALQVREGAQLLAEATTGTPLELDPGPHHFVATLPGFPPVDATYVLQAGDKARVVGFDFVSPPVAPRVDPPKLPPAQPAPSAAPRPIPALSYALAGVTLAAAATGSVLGVLALSERGDVEQRCAPLCRSRDVRGVEQLALASDIAFALAVLSAGATVYSYVARPEAPAPAQLSLLWTGLGVTAKGSF